MFVSDKFSETFSSIFKREEVFCKMDPSSINDPLIALRMDGNNRTCESYRDFIIARMTGPRRRELLKSLPRATLRELVRELNEFLRSTDHHVQK